MAADQRALPPDVGRYVVLRHELPTGQGAGHGRGDHFDWMFASQGRLLTWASEQFLPPVQAAEVTAVQLPPHRLHYLDYEGPVSGERGTVRQVETGQHRLREQRANHYEFALWGGRCGVLRIYRTVSSDSWLIAFEPSRDERPTRVEAS